MPYQPMGADGLIPPPEFFGISPPEYTATLAKDNPRALVYGFPLPSALIDHQFHYKCEIESLKGRDLRGEPESRREFMYDLNDDFISICREIYPEGAARMKMGVVKTSGYRGGICMFIIVGHPGRKPPREVVKKIKAALLEYGVLEKPAWYPVVPL